MNYIYWDKFNNEITALTTTRHFGNMAYHIEDDKELVKIRRSKLAQDLKLNVENVIYTYQSHSDKVEEVTIKDINKGCSSFESGVAADALYTTDSSLAIGVFHADCAPIFVYAPKAHLVAIIHASYKATLKHITYKTIKLLQEKYNLSGKDIYIDIGPYQNLVDFHVDKEDAKKIEEAKLEKALRLFNEDILFDLAFANIIDLRECDIPLKNIDVSEINTVDNKECFSAHTENKNNGRMVSVIKIND
ncbi:MAG: laccase domain-containing protein [Bacilli bacterium]